MSRRCSNLNCFTHEDEACALGEMTPSECVSWSANISKTELDAPTLSHASGRIIWSGSALGLADLANLTPRGRSILVGVLGAHDAGKTTLLLGNYLRLLGGHSIADASFAGSRTLGAWESLAAWTRFDDAARPPSFPPHTPCGTSRIPGLLHLSLRNSQDEFRDVLLTDAPGEWFSRWAIQEAAPDAEGARWVVQNADVFLVFADCQRLSGAQRGMARKDLLQLLERLGNHVAGRPTVLVWAKDDDNINTNERVQNAIRRGLNEQIPHAIEVRASASNPESLMNALEAALHEAWTPYLARSVVEPILNHQPFSAFRGSYANT